MIIETAGSLLAHHLIAKLSSICRLSAVRFGLLVLLVRGRGGMCLVWARYSLRGANVTRHHELVLLDMLVSHLLLGLAARYGISCVETASLMRVP